jgi:hypothetical protein
MRAMVASAMAGRVILGRLQGVSIQPVAGVAVATVFTHFLGKEALIFDEDPDSGPGRDQPRSEGNAGRGLCPVARGLALR